MDLKLINGSAKFCSLPAIASITVTSIVAGRKTSQVATANLMDLTLPVVQCLALQSLS